MSDVLPQYEGKFVGERLQTLEQIFPRSNVFTYPEVKICEVIPEINKLKGRTRPLLSLTPDDRRELAACGSSLHSGVWLLGLEERSPVSRNIAINDTGERYAVFHELFPESSDDDLKEKITGSAFAPRRPVPDPSLAANWDEVKQFADTMRKETGVQVWGDVIANHFSIDSPLLQQHPDWFVHKTTPPTGEETNDFFEQRIDDKTFWFAKATWSRHKQYYNEEVEPWQDIVQLNILNPDVQEFLIEIARVKGGIFDGLRVDAAALSDERVFAKMWRDVLPEDVDKIVDRLKEHPEERFWSRALAAAREAAAQEGRRLITTPETFKNFGLYNELEEAFGQVYDQGWTNAWMKAVNNEYDPGLQRKVEVSDLAEWLHDNMPSLAKKTLYLADQDGDPLARMLNEKKAIVANLAMMLLPAGSYLVAPLQEDGYAGRHLDVNLRDFPKFVANRSIKRTYETGLVLKNSELLQSPTSKYDIIPVFKNPADAHPRFHDQILPMQVISGNGQEIAIACTNLRPEKSSSMYVQIPATAEDLTVTDMTTGKLVTNRAEVNDGKLYIELGPDKLAQVIHYTISAPRPTLVEAA